MPFSQTRAWLASGAVILVYFALLAHGGFNAWFSGDDVINIAFLHGYGHTPIPVLAVQALSVFTPEYRPVGGVYYRVLYALFGLHAAPFRIAFFTLLMMNLALAAAWMRRISGSGMTAFVGVAILSYHAAMAGLYFNDGTIYDVLCLFFILLLLLLYEQAIPRDTLWLALLFGAALGSKEMAATVPGILVLCELLPGVPAAKWKQRAKPIAILALIDLICMTVKVFVPNPMSSNELYRPHFDFSTVSGNYISFHRMLLFDPHLSGLQLSILMAAALGIAAALRNRVMLFGLLFATLAFLPVIAIAPRAGFVCYLPLVGYALYVGEAISQLCRAIETVFHGRWLRVAMGGCVLSLCYVAQAQHPGLSEQASLAEDETALKTLLADAKTAAPSLPAGARVLLENDPYPRIAWEPMFLLRLGYENPTLWVDRNTPDQPGLYELRLHWDGAHYVAGPRPQPAISVALTLGPAIVHRGDSLTLHLSADIAACPLDIAYRMPDDELVRAGIWANQTTATLHIDQDAERGKVVIDHIRACHGAWQPTSAVFEIWP